MAGAYTFTGDDRRRGRADDHNQRERNGKSNAHSNRRESVHGQSDAGATQQFTATGKDQFGVALATQPTFTWATTTGTISAGGLLTAPSTSAINGTVTASNGTVSGAATFTVSTVQGTGQ